MFVCVCVFLENYEKLISHDEFPSYLANSTPLRRMECLSGVAGDAPPSASDAAAGTSSRRGAGPSCGPNDRSKSPWTVRQHLRLQLGA